MIKPFIILPKQVWESRTRRQKKETLENWRVFVTEGKEVKTK